MKLSMDAGIFLSTAGSLVLLTLSFHPPEYSSLSITHQLESIPLNSLPSIAVLFLFCSSAMFLLGSGRVLFQVRGRALERQGHVWLHLWKSHRDTAIGDNNHGDHSDSSY